MTESITLRMAGRTLLPENDCSATRTAAELGIHRNTVRNIISMVEERYAVSLDDSEEKMRYILSETDSWSI